MLRASLFKQCSSSLLSASLARGSIRSAFPLKKSIRLSSTSGGKHAGHDVSGGFILFPIAVAIGLFACFHHELNIDTYNEKSLKHDFEVASAEEKAKTYAAATAPGLVEVDLVEVVDIPGEEPIVEEESVILVEDQSEEKQEQGSEEQQQQAAAYNPETGEINWDCPCLGGMAHGPCGEEFKAAFSCFVYSESEPKGIDCIEKFKGMQDCFRQHPDVYAAELRDEEVPIKDEQTTTVAEQVTPVAVVEEVTPIALDEEVTPSAVVEEVSEEVKPLAVIEEVSEEVKPVTVIEEAIPVSEEASK